MRELGASVSLSVFATDTGKNARAPHKSHPVNTVALVFEPVSLVRGPSRAMVLWYLWWWMY